MKSYLTQIYLGGNKPFLNKEALKYAASECSIREELIPQRGIVIDASSQYVQYNQLNNNRHKNSLACHAQIGAAIGLRVIQTGLH